MGAFFETLRQAAEYLGGSREEPPEGWPLRHHLLLWGLWWAFLALVIILFCGQSSRFIYIDF